MIANINIILILYIKKGNSKWYVKILVISHTLFSCNYKRIRKNVKEILPMSYNL